MAVRERISSPKEYVQSKCLEVHLVQVERPSHCCVAGQIYIRLGLFDTRTFVFACLQGWQALVTCFLGLGLVNAVTLPFCVFNSLGSIESCDILLPLMFIRLRPVKAQNKCVCHREQDRAEIITIYFVLAEPHFR